MPSTPHLPLLVPQLPPPPIQPPQPHTHTLSPHHLVQLTIPRHSIPQLSSDPRIQDL